MSMGNGSNISHLSTPYTHSINAQRKYVRQVHVRRAKTILAVFAVIMVVLLGQLISSRRSLVQVNNNIKTTRVAINHQETKNAHLEHQIKLLHDPSYTQQLMREKYNYAKKGETIYNFAN